MKNLKPILCALLVMLFLSSNAYAQKKLAVYYGWPMSVNGSTTVAQAIDVFDDYDIVVFGGAMVDYKITQPTVWTDFSNIVAGLQPVNSTREVFGYVQLGMSNPGTTLTEDQIEARIDLWDELNVKGMFLDEGGYDYNVSRSRQNNIVDYVHSKGMKVMMNAWRPEDVLQDLVHATYNPNRVAANLGANTSIKDYYMLESFMVKASTYNKGYVDFAAEEGRYRIASDLQRQASNLGIVTVTTTAHNSLVDCRFNYAWWASLAYGFDAMGWGEKEFSSGPFAGKMENQLPYHQRPNPAPQVANNGSPFISGGILTRNTTTAGGVITLNTQTYAYKYEVNGTEEFGVADVDASCGGEILDVGICVTQSGSSTQSGLYYESETTGISECKCYNQLTGGGGNAISRFQGKWYSMSNMDCEFIQAQGARNGYSVLGNSSTCDPKELGCIQ